MEDSIAKLLKDVEKGKMDRRRLVQGLGLTAAAAFAAIAAPKAAPPEKVSKQSPGITFLITLPMSPGLATSMWICLG
jgi:hypothetical protein